MAFNRFNSNTNSNTPQPLVGFAGLLTDLGSLPGPNTFNQITPFTDIEIFDNVGKDDWETYAAFRHTDSH